VPKQNDSPMARNFNLMAPGNEFGGDRTIFYRFLQNTVPDAVD